MRFGKASANIRILPRANVLGQGGLGIQVAVYASLGAQHPPFDPGRIITCLRIIMTSMVWVKNSLAFVSNYCIDA